MIRIAKPTLVDRLVGVFSPAAALDRLRNRTMLEAWTGGYTGGRRSRRGTKNWHPHENSANADLIPDLPHLRSRSRDLVRNQPIAAGAMATYKTHVVGVGLMLDAQCDRAVLNLTEEQASAWNRLAEREFELAAKRIDFGRLMCLEEIEALAFGAALESGDVFVLRKWRRDPGDTYGTKVLVIEADRVCNPNRIADSDRIVGGIEYDDQKVAVAIHVTDRHPGDLMRKAVTWTRVPLRYADGSPVALHIVERLRPDQARGAPLFAPVIELFKGFTDYTEAEVRAAVVSAMFTVFISGTGDTDSSPLPTSGTDSGKAEVELGAGAIVDLGPNQQITTANPGRPNPVFDAFATAVLRQIGVALELPFELLIKHFTASYSASRAALEMAYHAFRKRRVWLARQLCQPIYEWVMDEAVLTGRISAPGYFDDPLIRAAWLNADWTGPVRISLDPKKEAEADTIDVEQGFKTAQQVMTERTGGDVFIKIEQRGREKSAMRDAGLDDPTQAPSAAAPASQADTDGSNDGEDS